jgi:hypothetical protein
MLESQTGGIMAFDPDILAKNMAKQWEYYSLEVDCAEMSDSKITIGQGLDSLGKEGWELVGFANANKPKKPQSFVFILKRPKH